MSASRGQGPALRSLCSPPPPPCLGQACLGLLGLPPLASWSPVTRRKWPTREEVATVYPKGEIWAVSLLPRGQPPGKPQGHRASDSSWASFPQEGWGERPGHAQPLPFSDPRETSRPGHHPDKGGARSPAGTPERRDLTTCCAACPHTCLCPLWAAASRLYGEGMGGQVRPSCKAWGPSSCSSWGQWRLLFPAS